MPSWLPIALSILIALGFVAWLSRVFRAGVQTTELQPFIEAIVTKAITDAIVREDGAIRKRLDEQKALIDTQQSRLAALNAALDLDKADKLKHFEETADGISRIEEGIEKIQEGLRNGHSHSRSEPPPPLTRHEEPKPRRGRGRT